MKVVDESVEDQKKSLHSIPGTVAAHKQGDVNDDRMKPVGDKAMQGGKFN